MDNIELKKIMMEHAESQNPGSTKESTDWEDFINFVDTFASSEGLLDVCFDDLTHSFTDDSCYVQATIYINTVPSAITVIFDYDVVCDFDTAEEMIDAIIKHNDTAKSIRKQIINTPVKY